MTEKLINFLVVEDNDLDAEKIERTFKKLGIVNPIVRAKNGVEALDYLRAENSDGIKSPRVVLLDLNMPKMNGLEFLEKLREDSTIGSTPVFVFTTSDDRKDVEAAFRFNVQGYIVKPIKRDQMIDALGILNAYWHLTEHPEKPII